MGTTWNNRLRQMNSEISAFRSQLQSCQAKTFDVVGQCTPSHVGKAKVIPCSSNHKAFGLASAVSWWDIDMDWNYVESHWHLNPSGNSKLCLAKCTKEYHLTGCRPKVSCMSDATAEGYDVTAPHHKYIHICEIRSDADTADTGFTGFP